MTSWLWKPCPWRMMWTIGGMFVYLRTDNRYGTVVVWEDYMKLGTR